MRDKPDELQHVVSPPVILVQGPASLHPVITGELLLVYQIQTDRTTGASWWTPVDADQGLIYNFLKTTIDLQGSPSGDRLISWEHKKGGNF
jgi:hypothetical protein